MDHAKLWHKTNATIVWVLIIAAISGMNAVSLVSTSPVTATATANPIFQLNTTGKCSESKLNLFKSNIDQLCSWWFYDLLERSGPNYQCSHLNSFHISFIL